MAIQSGKMLKGKVTINIVFYMLKVLKMNTRKIVFSLTFLQLRKFFYGKVHCFLDRESLCPDSLLVLILNCVDFVILTCS